MGLSRIIVLLAVLTTGLSMPGFAWAAACLTPKTPGASAPYNSPPRAGVFTYRITHNPHSKTPDITHHRYRVKSITGDKVRWFFEEGAVVNGVLTVPLRLAVNKLGHAMHDLDPAFETFSRTPNLAAVAADLGFGDPKLLQSMYIFKQPGIGGEVSLHCDHTFLWTEPQSVIGFWFAIEDATQENGCLWVHPGGHRIPVKSRYRMTPDLTEAEMETLDPEPYSTDDLVPLEADAGTPESIRDSLSRSGWIGC